MGIQWWQLSPLNLWKRLPKHFHRGFGLGFADMLGGITWQQFKLMSGFQLLLFFALHVITALI